jgi:hypothetical protein
VVEVVFTKLAKVTVVEDYKLHLIYMDGADGIFDFASSVGFYGVFEKLRDPALFRKARISRDVWKTLGWPGRLDLDPVVLYSRVTGKSIEWIQAQKEQPNRKGYAGRL